MVMFVIKGGRIGTPHDMTRRVLLVLDDNQNMLKMYVRILKNEFDELVMANTPEQAEKLLESNDVTHLISDYDLGEDLPKGTELVSKWREKYPAIESAVLITGTDLELVDESPNVYSIMAKPIDPLELKEVLLR